MDVNIDEEKTCINWNTSTVLFVLLSNNIFGGSNYYRRASLPPMDRMVKMGLVQHLHYFSAKKQT